MDGNGILQSETKKQNVFVLEAQYGLFPRRKRISEDEVEEPSRERIAWNKLKQGGRKSQGILGNKSFSD